LLYPDGKAEFDARRSSKPKEIYGNTKSRSEWKGNLIEGSGRLKVGSGAFDGPYSFKSDLKNGNRLPIRRS